MDRSTKKILDTLSSINYITSTRFRFHKSYNDNKRYNDGRLVAHEYIADIIFHFQLKEKHLLSELKNTICDKKKDLSILKDNDYKRGIFDALDEVIDELYKITNNKSITYQK